MRSDDAPYLFETDHGQSGRLSNELCEKGVEMEYSKLSPHSVSILLTGGNFPYIHVTTGLTLKKRSLFTFVYSYY